MFVKDVISTKIAFNFLMKIILSKANEIWTTPTYSLTHFLFGSLTKKNMGLCNVIRGIFCYAVLAISHTCFAYYRKSFCNVVETEGSHFTPFIFHVGIILCLSIHSNPCSSFYFTGVFQIYTAQFLFPNLNQQFR